MTIQASLFADPRDKFLHNGHPNRAAMLEHMAQQEKFRHECEVKHLLSMSYPNRVAALALRESKRGPEAAKRLRDDMQKSAPGEIIPNAARSLTP